jgi:hypothetical protein
MPESLKFYMDVHVPISITKGLRTRGITIITAQEDNHAQAPDSDLLNRAAFLQCVVYTNDTEDSSTVFIEVLRNL